MSVSSISSIAKRNTLLKDLNKRYNELSDGRNSIASNPNGIVNAQRMSANGGILETFCDNIGYVMDSIDGMQEGLRMVLENLDECRQLTGSAVRNTNQVELDKLQDGVRNKLLQAFNDLSQTSVVDRKIFAGECSLPLTEEQCQRTGVPQDSQPLSIFLSADFTRSLTFHEARLLPGNGLQSDVPINQAFEPIFPISVIAKIDVSADDCKRDLRHIAQLQSSAADAARGMVDILPALKAIQDAYLAIVQNEANDQSLRSFAEIASAAVRELSEQYNQGGIQLDSVGSAVASCTQAVTKAILAKQDTISFVGSDLMTKMVAFPVNATAQEAADFIKNLQLTNPYQGQQALLNQFIAVQGQVLGALDPAKSSATDYFAALINYVCDAQALSSAQRATQFEKFLPAHAVIAGGANVAAARAALLGHYDALLGGALDAQTRATMVRVRAKMAAVVDGDLDVNLDIASSQLIAMGFQSALEDLGVDSNAQFVLSKIATTIIADAVPANARAAVVALNLGADENKSRAFILAAAKVPVAGANAADYLKSIVLSGKVLAGAVGGYRCDIFDGAQDIAIPPAAGFGADQNAAKAAVRAAYVAIVDNVNSNAVAKRIAQAAISAIDAIAFPAAVNTAALGGNYSMRAALLGSLEKSGLSKDAVAVLRVALNAMDIAADCAANKAAIDLAIAAIPNQTAEQQAIVAAISAVAAGAGAAGTAHQQMLAMLSNAGVMAACGVDMLDVVNTSGMGSNPSQRGVAGASLAMMHITDAIGPKKDNWFELRSLKRASLQDPIFRGDAAMVREYNFVLDNTLQGVYSAGIITAPSAHPTEKESERLRIAIAKGLERMAFAQAIVSAGALDLNPAEFSQAVIRAREIIATKVGEWGERSSTLEATRVQLANISRNSIALADETLNVDEVSITEQMNALRRLVNQTDVAIGQYHKDSEAIIDLIKQLTR